MNMILMCCYFLFSLIYFDVDDLASLWFSLSDIFHAWLGSQYRVVRRLFRVRFTSILLLWQSLGLRLRWGLRDRRLLLRRSHSVEALNLGRSWRQSERLLLNILIRDWCQLLDVWLLLLIKVVRLLLALSHLLIRLLGLQCCLHLLLLKS